MRGLTSATGRDRSAANSSPRPGDERLTVYSIAPPLPPEMCSSSPPQRSSLCPGSPRRCGRIHALQLSVLQQLDLTAGLDVHEPRDCNTCESRSREILRSDIRGSGPVAKPRACPKCVPSHWLGTQRLAPENTPYLSESFDLGLRQCCTRKNLVGPRRRSQSTTLIGAADQLLPVCCPPWLPD